MYAVHTDTIVLRKPLTTVPCNNISKLLSFVNQTPKSPFPCAHIPPESHHRLLNRFSPHPCLFTREVRSTLPYTLYTVLHTSILSIPAVQPAPILLDIPSSPFRNSTVCPHFSLILIFFFSFAYILFSRRYSNLPSSLHPRRFPAE